MMRPLPSKVLLYAACEHAHTVYPSHPHTNDMRGMDVSVHQPVSCLCRRALSDTPIAARHHHPQTFETAPGHIHLHTKLQTLQSSSGSPPCFSSSSCDASGLLGRGGPAQQQACTGAAPKPAAHNLLPSSRSCQPSTAARSSSSSYGPSSPCPGAPAPQWSSP